MANFDKWVTKMNTYFEKDYLNGVCDVEWFFDGKVTICYDITNNKIGIAKCHPDDENDFHIGKAIAYARCKGYDVPKQKVKVYKKLSEMKNGETFRGVYGTTFRYIGKNGNAYVSYCLEHKDYRTMPFNVEYEMVD